MSLLEANVAPQSFDDAANHSCNVETSREPSCMSTKHVNNQLTIPNFLEKNSQEQDFSVQTQKENISSACYQGTSDSVNMDSLQYEPGNQSNYQSIGTSVLPIEESSKKNLDEQISGNPVLNPCFVSGSRCKAEAVVSTLSFLSNERVLNEKNSQGLEIIQDNEGMRLQPVPESFVREFSDSQLGVQCHSTSELICIGHGDLHVEKQGSKLLHVNGQIDPSLHELEDDSQNYTRETKNNNLESESLDQDHSIALWVKWRGKWQTGIQCSRTDCPLPTLRVKPTHDRKKYTIVFFPHTRTHSWVDTQLVRSINDLPQSLANGTHISWLALVEDLNSPRHYITWKLALSMLNVSDQLHTEAVAETARRAAYWKDFAVEASCCRSYSDLGKMLVKLQQIILPEYVDPNWLQNSCKSWIHKSQNAQSAEAIELLTEQIVDSVLWKDIEELWNAPVKPELGSEWRAWKQEAMKLFSASNPSCRSGDPGRESCNYYSSIVPEVSRKRPKLEVRRSDVFTSEAEAEITGYQSKADNMESDCSYIQCKDFAKSSMACYPHEEEASRNMTKNINIENKDLHGGLQEPVANAVLAASGSTTKGAELGSQRKFRRCFAFIEAKGRQCGRWASDGEIYCCVHMNGPPACHSSQAEPSSPLEALMCEGTTVHGTKCKHKARQGSVFCKKHGRSISLDVMESKNFLSSSEDKTMSNHREDGFPEIIFTQSIAFSEKTLASLDGDLVHVVIKETLDEGNCLMNESNIYKVLPAANVHSENLPLCIGYGYDNNEGQCVDTATRYMYCEKHIPNFLKHGRDDKTPLISHHVFMDLLKSCTLRLERIYLHRACELLYNYMKTNLCQHDTTLNKDQMEYLLSLVEKDKHVGEFLLKLVSTERHTIRQAWGFDTETDNSVRSFETKCTSVEAPSEKDRPYQMTIRCKICLQEFGDNQALGIHWRSIHKKEAQWLFRGYACAICMSSFTNRKVLEAHVTDKHGFQFLEHATLLRCMSCNSHLPSLEKLWEHILSFHSCDFKHTTVPQKLGPSSNHDSEMKLHTLPPIQSVNTKIGGTPYAENGEHKEAHVQRFICKLCGLRFDLLPDLGRHHQVAHGNTTSMNRLKRSRTNRHLKCSKFHHTGFKKCSGMTHRIKNTNFGVKKDFQASSSVIAARLRLQSQASEAVSLQSLLESHCSNIAKRLFDELRHTKRYLSNPEILAIARTACCQTYIQNALVEKTGIPLRNICVKAAKLCGELNLSVSWHLEGFICPKGCRPLNNQHYLDPLFLMPIESSGLSISSVDHVDDGEWEMEECHYVVSPKHLSRNSSNSIVLCEDISSGREPVPVACVIDRDLKHLLTTSSDGTNLGQNFSLLPWLGFTYVTERLLDPSLSIDTTSSQLGCGCNQKCYAGNCDHVYLFNNDNETAKDVHGKAMHGRFPYDGSGRIILEDGYLVYECNSMCKCDKTCPNRVLQNGLQIKLEVFRTERKGWAVRAVEPISRGTFVCEYIGEVLNDYEANKRGLRYNNQGCSYLYDIDAHVDNGGRLSEVLAPFVIDATNYGNVSRFINHSCSPNLVNYQALVESMDCQLAHIGLYASRDIAAGEELVYDYRYKLLPGDGCPCHCGSSECRGRLY